MSPYTLNDSAMAIIEEFKKFALRGNAVDIAVGLTVGAGFTGLVNSFVSDILNPPIGLLTGRVALDDQSIILKAAEEGSDPVVLSWGSFISSMLDFLIIAIVVFFIIKLINRLTHKEELNEVQAK